MLRACLILLVGLATVRAADIHDIIPEERLYPWQANVTVGPVGGVPSRSNIVPVNCNTNGTADCSAAINAKYASGVSGQVHLLLPGRHRLDNTVGGITKSDFTIRGSGMSNTTVILNHNNSAGFNLSSDVKSFDVLRRFTVVSALRGSTNITLTSTTNGYGEVIQPGWLFSLATRTANIATSTNPFISTFGRDYIFTCPVEVYSRSGTNISITQPLPDNFTNDAVLVQLTGVANKKIWLEDMTITTSNEVTGATSGTGLIYLVNMNGVRQSGIRNVRLQWGNNYHIHHNYSINTEISGCIVERARSSGQNHSGLLLTTTFGVLVENNYWANGLDPAIEIKEGVMGTVLAYNYGTNVNSGILYHNTHPAYNLEEGNVWWYTVSKEDGYFGSTSRNTKYRHRIMIGTPTKRFSFEDNWVGCVLGAPTVPGATNQYVLTNGAAIPPYPVFEDGLPNLGNFSYTGTTDDAPWNFPGATYVHPITGVTWQNGTDTLTGQGPTTTLSGNFTNIFSMVGIENQSGLIFQAPAPNTNIYYGPCYATANGTTTTLTISTAVTVTNGSRLYKIGPPAYQQWQKQLAATHIRHRNVVNTGGVWSMADRAGVTQTNLQASLFRTSKPSYFGDLLWPPIGPDVSAGGSIESGVQWHSPIPTEQWPLGFTIPDSGGGGESTTGGTGAATIRGAINLRSVILRTQ